MKVNPLEQKIITNIKTLSLDMINNAKSGHPGIALGAAPIIYTLYAKHMNISTTDQEWANRDRFIMSAGHGSALLYSVLFMAGYNITLDDLKNFRQLNSKTPGHPEYMVTPGVDFSTGPLGQGIASAVGMAMAERYLAHKFNSNEKNVPKLFDHNIYVLCGDGDLMEGVSYEACSLAATQKLGKLIVLYDSNDVSLDGEIKNTFTESVLERFDAMGWHTQKVKKIDDVDSIDRAITRAKKVVDKPSIIEIKSIIGSGSIEQGTNKVHGSPLSEQDFEQVKAKLGIRAVPFAISKEAVEEFRRQILTRSSAKYSEWGKAYHNLVDSDNEFLKTEYNSYNSKQAVYNLLENPWDYTSFDNLALRDTNFNILNTVSQMVPNLIGGCADVARSTKVYFENHDFMSYVKPLGKNIAFGVREHAMGAILNGISVYGFRCVGSTMLSFSDYLKPAIRMSALMDLPVTYVFTHDSIENGEDGPTHQPIEQLAMLRSIPNFNVYRPCDAREVIGAWNSIFKSHSPAAIIISKKKLPLYENSDSSSVDNGAYILKKEKGQLHAIIIATGAEVKTAVLVSEALETRGINLRVVSMPCMEKFLLQTSEYRKQILPVGYKTFVIEAGSSFGWHRFVYNDNYLFTVDAFGTSGKPDDVIQKYELDAKQILMKIMKLLQ